MSYYRFLERNASYLLRGEIMKPAQARVPRGWFAAAFRCPARRLE